MPELIQALKAASKLIDLAILPLIDLDHGDSGNAQSHSKLPRVRVEHGGERDVSRLGGERAELGQHCLARTAVTCVEEEHERVVGDAARLLQREEVRG